ncbi:hypothetical protein UCRNP2_1816 [Neofusicoccum parvum UCRNP2]|uniref:Uncharacterized protein n=1 Tax=Botryosphaeria parva (strain UCR-NP2) TaxID=1287680 RepID=R1EUC8_BOTPV|nr:hypothetical protein UCRNP2_1816 [Neofusicoccum parvum UCRNP2]
MKLIATTAAILGFLAAGITNATPIGSSGPLIVEHASNLEQENAFKGPVSSNPGPVIADSDMDLPPVTSNSDHQHGGRDAKGLAQGMGKIRKDTVEPLQDTGSADVDDLKAEKERQRKEWADRRTIAWGDN